LRRYIAAVGCLLLTSVSAFAQLTTEGRDFWFGFMDNSQPDFVTLEVYVTAKEDAIAELTNFGGTFSTTVNVAANTSVAINVPISFLPEAEGKFNLGLHLTSDVDVSVYSLNKRTFSADAAVILPTNVLGREYLVMAHRELPGDGQTGHLESEFLIVATENATTIEVTPSVTTFTGWPAGITQTITLNKGETYQVKGEQDLTGSRVKVVSSGSSCSPIAVFGGNKFTNVGGCGGNRDHLIEQMFPISTWGKNFIYVPYKTRVGGDYVKIMAAEDGTTVRISGVATPVSLNSGETHIIKALTGVRQITGDKPLQIAQLSRSQECDGVFSDPFMIILSPLEQRIKEVSFEAFQVDEISQYYLTLIAANDGFSDITLDGTNIASEFTVRGNGAYASLDITRGTHKLFAPDGVIAYVYGYGLNESFGYSAGVNLSDLSLSIEGNDPDIGIVNPEACLNNPVVFDAVPVDPDSPTQFVSYDWDMGDGTLLEGEQVEHTFTQPGEYTVTLVAETIPDDCGESRLVTVVRDIDILEVIAEEIVGAVSVCPDVEEIEYSVEGPADNTYEWTVVGGTISGSATGSSILVDWGVARDDALVSVQVKNYLGCTIEPMDLPVVINKRLEPALPTGPSEVCFTDYAAVEYSTPATNGSEYFWYVEGGSFTGSNTSNQVTVQWDGPGVPGKIWYREYNPLITDCEGFSEEYEVTVYTDILVTANETEVLCFGDANGVVTFDISGGKPGNYRLLFEGTEIVSNRIDGLAEGIYDVTVIDALDCTKDLSFVIGSPDLLEITGLTILDVRCFQESNGSVTATVTGGTPAMDGAYNFAIRRQGETAVIRSGLSDLPMVNDLPVGAYTITITDENACETSEDFVIAEPPLLEADLETLINQAICPGASDGTALIDAKGGTPDYQFYWSNNETTDQQLGENFSLGSYTVRIVDANGCETSLTIDQEERFPKIFIPNAFSPNGDGENDEFKPVTDCNLNYSLQVFNQWGSITFATKDITEGWDGTLDGQNAPDGKYSYIIFYSGSLNGVSFEETLRGTLRLIR
jgi:gliding motility-associated-like protein